MKKIVTKILLLILATCTCLQFILFVIHFFSGWSHESAPTPALKSGTFYVAELQKNDQQLENAKQEQITAPRYLSDLSTLQFRHKTSLITKRICAQHYELLILVASAPPNLQRRNNIRLTWAFRRALKPRWTTVFLVAQVQNQPLSNFLLREDEVYGDLVRADYFDHYWNQTRKIQMGFEWAIRLDDVYVGMLAKKTGIKIVHADGFELNSKRPELQCTPSTNFKTLIRHGVEGNCLIEMYHRAVLSRRDSDRSNELSHT
ncbi:uncharacterized protein LOC113673299 [Pocillopora damicornis]|uniref:uncharacterized protein LOC113673299 n=1 Tax=Pocillopora damicornis TaxID=46731 RepID=UPI000F5597D7|nr:uncharacterized protein LOC113673299 [Pocillopora damicornis]